MVQWTSYFVRLFFNLSAFSSWGYWKGDDYNNRTESLGAQTILLCNVFFTRVGHAKGNIFSYLPKREVKTTEAVGDNDELRVVTTKGIISPRLSEVK